MTSRDSCSCRMALQPSGTDSVSLSPSVPKKALLSHEASVSTRVVRTPELLV